MLFRLFSAEYTRHWLYLPTPLIHSRNISASDLLLLLLCELVDPLIGSTPVFVYAVLAPALLVMSQG